MFNFKLLMFFCMIFTLSLCTIMPRNLQAVGIPEIRSELEASEASEASESSEASEASEASVDP